MNRLPNNAQTTYSFESSKLKELRKTSTPCCVRGNIFQLDQNVYAQENNKFSLIAKGGQAYKIDYWPRPSYPTVMEIFATAKSNVQQKDVNPALYRSYLTMSGPDFRHAHKRLVDGAVAIIPKDMSDTKLFVSELGFLPDFGPKLYAEGVCPLSMLHRECIVSFNAETFLYRGFVFALNKQNTFAMAHAGPLMTAKEYMLFWCGGQSVFALEQREQGTVITALGSVEQYIQTNVTDFVLIREEKRNGKLVLYHLGSKLEFITACEFGKHYIINPRSGSITVKCSDDLDSFLVYKSMSAGAGADEIEAKFLLKKDHYETMIS